MIVMKFGGSSVANTERIRQVVDIVKTRLPKRPVVVASAFRGVTDDLFKLAEEAVKGVPVTIDKIEKRHRDTLAEMGLDVHLLDPLYGELSVLLKGISLVKELTPRTLDYVVSFGERLSTRIIAAYFTKAGIPAEQHDAFDIGLLTNDEFGGAQPLPEADAEIKRHLSKTQKLPIVTGYIGKTRNGDITTLGRNGSDFSATILGAALDAEEIEIWSDVDGIMTADPRIAPTAKPIDTLTFDEASELAYYGGKVLHPATITPAVRKRIPVRCLNTFKPDHPGTAIVPTAVGSSPKGIKSIAHNLKNLIITISSPRMLQGHGFLARIFEIFGRHKISVDMVSTSEVTVSVTVDTNRNLEAAVAELRKFAEVSVEQDKAIICVVGEGLRNTRGIAGDVFSALRDDGVNVLMISQGASKISIAFVVEDADAPKAVQAMHRKFFGC
ncbi:MAG TPA: aspartate kinase [Planctomycetota bacterium]|nr:aspartate kinase [Planctomycetota bacterium]